MTRADRSRRRRQQPKAQRRRQEDAQRLEDHKAAEERRVEPAIKYTWRQYREKLGKSADRRQLLKFFCYASGYSPLPHQVAAHLAEPASRAEMMHKLMLGGIGAGKTHWAIAEMAMCVIANPGCRFLIAAPTYDQAMNVLQPMWQQVCEGMQRRGFPLQKRFLTQLQVGLLHCGGKVFFRTYSKVGNLLGFEFAAVMTDEICTVSRSQEIWDALHGRVRQPLANWRQMFGSSTPNGLQEVTETFHNTRGGLVGDDLRAWYWVRSTGYQNPYLPPDYLPSLRKSYSKRRWDQEVLAKILRPEAAVWPEFDMHRHVKPWPYDPTMPYDLAYDAGDQFPHVLWIQRTPWGESVIFDELCPDGMPLDHLHAEIINRCRRLKRAPEHGVGDRAVKSELQWLMHTFPATQIHRMRTRKEQSVNEGVELVRMRLDPLDGPPKIYVSAALAKDPPRRGIVNCLQNYRYRRRADGALLSEPYKDNVNDHGADAFRMHQVALYARDTAVFGFSRKYG